MTETRRRLCWRPFFATCCYWLTACSLAQAQVWGAATAGRSAGSACGPAGCNVGSQQPSLTADQFLDRIGRESARAVCRVRVDDGGGTSSVGSGTLVAAFADNTGLVVTNAHVVRDRRSNQNAGEIIYLNGESSRFSVNASDDVWDFAILEVEKAPREIPVIELQATPPAIGETLMIAGYIDGQLQAGTGVYAARMAPRANMPAEWLELQPIAAQQGQSGGAIFTTSGKLAGAIWGGFGTGNGAYTVGAPCHRIRAIVDRIRQRFGKLPRPSLPPGNVATNPMNPPDRPQGDGWRPSTRTGPLPEPATSLPAAEGAGPSVTPSFPPSERERPDTQRAGGDEFLERLKRIEEGIAKANRDAAQFAAEHPAAAKAAEGAALKAAETAIGAKAPAAGSILSLLAGALGLSGVGLPIAGGIVGGAILGPLAFKIGVKIGKSILGKLAARRAARRRNANDGSVAGMDAGGARTPHFVSPDDLVAFGKRLQDDLLAGLQGKKASKDSTATGGETAKPSASFPQLADRSLEYGKQLLQLRGLTGVDPVVAATRGIVGDDFLAEIATGKDEVAARLATDFRRQINDRVSDIHPLAVKINDT